MRSIVVLVLVPLLASASAFAFVTLPLTKLQRSGAYLKGVPDADRQRAALLKGRGGRGPVTVPATNLAYIQYTTKVGIGKPPTYYNLVVDTGSSNTFCGTGKPYVRTHTSIQTGQNVSVIYGSGYFFGIEYLDQVTLAPDLVITNQSIGDALNFASFKDVDGILGVGPVNLTQGTLNPDYNALIPTVMDTLESQKHIDEEVLSIFFAPPTSSKDQNGALTYGGIDRHLYKGELTYTPVTKAYPSSLYWGIDIKSCTYGKDKVIPTVSPGIVDTGTTLVMLADDFFQTYQSAIPNATIDATTGLLEIPEDAIAHMHPLKFTIAGREFTLDVNAQLIPEDENTAYGGQPGKRYGVVLNLNGISGGGLDFILGQKFLERYFSVYDTQRKRVGFAQTCHTFA